MLIRYSIVLTNVLAIVFMVQLWVQNRGKFAGISLWVIGYTLQVIGFFLDLQGLPLPKMIADLIAFGLVIIGVFILYLGLERFVGIKKSYYSSTFGLVVFLLFMAYFVLVKPNTFIPNTFEAVFFHNVAVAVIALRGCWLLLRGTSAHLKPITRTVSWVMLLYALVAIAGLFLIGNPIPSIPPPPPLGPGNFSVGWVVPVLTLKNLLTLAITFGLILMVSQRLLLDVRVSEEHHRRVVNFLPDSLFIQSQGEIVFTNEAATGLLGADSVTELHGTKMDKFLRSHDGEAVPHRTPQAVAHNQAKPVDKKVRRLNGEWVDVAVAELPFIYREEPAILTVARDITERKQFEAERRKAREKIQRQIQFLRAAIESMPEPFYVINVGDGSIEIANQATRAMSKNKAFTCHTLAGRGNAPCMNPMEMCPVRLVVAKKESVVVERTYLDQHGERVYLEVHGSPIFDLQGNVVQIVEYMVDISESRRAAAAEERNRLAQELHDAVSQTLFTANIVAEAVPEAWHQDPQVGQRGMQEVQQLTSGALAEMRMLLLELRPQAMIENTLGGLMQQLTQAITSRHQIPTRLNIIKDATLPAEVQHTFYRILQESFNNIVKHAQASQVDVSLDCDPVRVDLLLEDNGCGFDTKGAFHGHMGLNIMRERADKIGAELAITSEVGQGTQTALHWSEPRRNEP